MAYNILIALLIGAAIGLERESGEDTTKPGFLGGVRTFSLVGLLGALAGVFYTQGFIWGFCFLALAFATLVITSYILGAKVSQDVGITTEIALILTFTIGLLLTTTALPAYVTIAIAVVVMLILALRTKTPELYKIFHRKEVEELIVFAIIVFVVFPFLPDQSITLSSLPLLSDGQFNLGKYAGLELLNPRKLWYVVLLLTSIDVFGHILSKFIGKKRGVTFASFLAGFASSTSATQSLALKSKDSSTSSYLVGAALLANTASFFQILLLVGPLNPAWMRSLFPTILILIITGLLLSTYFLRKKEPVQEAVIDEGPKKIFSLIPALKFSLLLIAVKLVTKVCLLTFGQSGFLVSSVLASLAGLDAILITLAETAGKSISFQFALIAFLLVNATNLVSKMVYSYFLGGKPFTRKFSVAATIIIVTSAIGLVF